MEKINVLDYQYGYYEKTGKNQYFAKKYHLFSQFCLTLENVKMRIFVTTKKFNLRFSIEMIQNLDQEAEVN